MSFSQNWEGMYKNSKQLSIWPWDDIVGIFHKIPFQVPHDQLRILELGCGAGANIPFFRSKNSEYYAVDGSQDIIGKLKTQYDGEEKIKLAVSDFSKSFHFDGKFDLIFDRASITHNNSVSVKKIIEQVKLKLKPGGFFMGIHWFAADNTYAKLGLADGEENTRKGFADGPYLGIEPVHFFSESEIRELFSDFEIIYFEHIKRVRNLHIQKSFDYTMWNFVFKLK